MNATELAREVLVAMVESGVREVVVAPGSRNAPLSFAALALAEAGHVRLHTRIDERSAGFLALGLTKEGSRAAVICTSGTAVANLHPAILEAAHTGLDLVVVTADRPRRLSGTSANQTTEQVGVFGPLVRTWDVETFSDESVAGLMRRSVCHLNVRLDEPLVSEEPWDLAARGRLGERFSTRISSPEPLTLDRTGVPTVVVAGDDAGPDARRWAEASGVPLLAEPSSGSRTGDHALRCYRLLLDGTLASLIERVVVFGHPTLSRPVSRLLARDDVEVLAQHGSLGAVWPQHPFPHDGFLELETDPDARPGWLQAWQEADRSVSRQLDALLAAEPDLTPWEATGAVSRALPSNGLLVVGPSSPIRDLDLMARPYPVGERRKVIANRGLAGIDGVVSTAIGAALAKPRDRVLALMGDVTFLHDSNGLIIGPGQPVPDLTIVVVNDDGGSIFTMLEQGAPAYADAFEQLFGTPHGVDVGALCAATRTPHWRVEGLPELEQALASPNGGIEVVEVRVRRDNRRAIDERIRALRP